MIGPFLKREDFMVAAIEDKILVFGGRGSSISYHPDYVFKDMIIVNINSLSFVRIVEQKGTTGKEFGRKRAAYCVVGRSVILHGGLDDED